MHLVLLVALGGLSHQPDEPPFSVVDLDQGESAEVALSNGEIARVELLERICESQSESNRDWRLRNAMTQYSAVVFPEQLEMDVAASRTPEASATKGPYTRVRWEDVWALAE